MSIKWTEDYIQHVLNTLKNSASYQEALDQIKETGSAIRSAFRMAGLNAPSTYIGANAGTSDENTQEDASEDEGDDFDDAAFEDFIHPENYYVSGNWVMVYTPKRFYKIPKDKFEGMHYDYSCMIPGGSLTINQICKKYGIRRVDFVRIKTACRWTHDNDPYTDSAHLNNDATALANDLIQKHRQAFEVKFRQKELVELRRAADNWNKVVAFLGGEQEFDSFKNRLDRLKNFKEFCSTTSIEQLDAKVDLGGPKGSRVLVIPVSDLHAGKTYTPDPISGYSPINKDVLKARISKMVAYIEDHAKTGQYDQIVYLALGDDFESLFGNMRDGQGNTMDMHTMEQYQFVISFHVTLLKTVMKSFPQAEKIALFQGGNHDRLFKSKEWNSESFITHIVVERIEQEFKNIPMTKGMSEKTNFRFKAGRPVMSIRLANGTNLISQHGHVGKIGSEKDIVNYVTLHGDKTSKEYLVVQGHLHKLFFQSVNNIKYLINPSICGPDDYSHYHINKSAPAEFVMLASSPEGNQLVGPFAL